MAKYLIKASYSTDGLKGVMAGGGSQRVERVRSMLTGVGGSVESFYFAFGGTDIFVIVDVPDHSAAAAVAAAVSASGAMSSYETVVLLTPEEVDAAMQLAVDYSPPGA